MSINKNRLERKSQTLIWVCWLRLSTLQNLELPRTGLWPCLCDIILIAFIKVGRPTHWEWQHSLRGILDDRSGEWEPSIAHVFMVLCFLVAMWWHPAASSSFHLDLPTMTDHPWTVSQNKLSLEGLLLEQALSHLRGFCQSIFFFFILAAGEETKTLE